MFEIISQTSDERSWLKSKKYELCTSVEYLQSYLSPERCLAARYVGADTEASSKNVEKSKLVGFSFSLEPNHGLYVPVGHKVGYEHNLPLAPVIDHLKLIDSLPNVWTIWWHHKYDGESIWRNTGWWVQNWLDAMIAVYLENPNLNVYGLKECIQRMKNIKPLEHEDVIGNRSFDLLHPTDVVDYTCQDADYCRDLFLDPKVQAAIKEQQFIWDLERMVLPEIRTGEMNHVYLDMNRLLYLQGEVQKKIPFLLAEIYHLAGGEFNVGSPVRLGEKLIALGIPITERTKKSGQVETGKEVLEKYKNHHPIIPKIQQWKELTTQGRNYIDKMIESVRHFGPSVKFPFHQIGVPTGRMKAGGEAKDINEAFEKGVMPINVQSTPDPDKKPYLPNIRAAIVAVMAEDYESALQHFEDGLGDFVIVAVDYSQVELRIAANMSREPEWIKTFSTGGDIHLKNAMLAYRDYKMQEDDVRRKKGKTMSFAILYGGSEWTVANHGGISVEQAKILVENFFGGARQLSSWIKSWIAAARAQKFVKTYFGRKRPLHEFYPGEHPTKDTGWLWRKGDREAVNDPIQGGAADIFKIGVVKLGKLIRERNWTQDVQQTMWIHDEFVLRVRKSMLEVVVPEIVKCLEFDIKNWPVKLKVDVEIGPNWGEMVKWPRYLAIGYLSAWKEKLEKAEKGKAILPGDESDLLEEEAIGAEGWR